MRTKISLLSLIVIFIISCGNSKKVDKAAPKDQVNRVEKIKGLNWILGKWEMNNNPGITTETWTVLNDSVYIGESITIGSGKDTLFYETIRIEQRGEDLFYIPVVTNQNEGKPVEFKRILLESYPANGQEVVFENPEHDFPQKINYQLKGDSLIAFISGKFEGKEHIERFPMIKSK